MLENREIGTHLQPACQVFSGESDSYGFVPDSCQSMSWGDGARRHHACISLLSVVQFVVERSFKAILP